MVNYVKGGVGSSGVCEEIADTYPNQLKQLWRKTEQTGNEWTQAYFRTQSGLMYTRQYEGDRDEVDSAVFEEVFKEIPDHAEENMLVHTHPSYGLELSMNDMVSFLKTSLVAENPYEHGLSQGVFALTSLKPITGRNELSIYGLELKEGTTAGEVKEKYMEVQDKLKDTKSKIDNRETITFPDLRAQTVELLQEIMEECGATVQMDE